MTRYLRFIRRIFALGTWLMLLPATADVARGQSGPVSFNGPPMSYPVASSPDMVYPMTTTPGAETWIMPPDDQPAYVDADVYCDGSPVDGSSLIDPSPPDTWFWQVLPTGLIYRSYQAGVHEPRIGVVFLDQQDGRSLWDAMVGGRGGLLGFGDDDGLRPQGGHLDVEGPALPRLTLDEQRDLDSVDFRFG